MEQSGEIEQNRPTNEPADQPTTDAPIQATCGVCGRLLDPEVDDLYVELCLRCESVGLKGRQSRTRVRAPHPRRF